jgi:hypothetical protein
MNQGAAHPGGFFNLKSTNTALSAEAPDVIFVTELTPEVRRLCELRTLMRAAKRDTRAIAECRETLASGTCADPEGFR